MKKNENGVTLIALAIMVIVMLMIASVTVNWKQFNMQY